LRGGAAEQRLSGTRLVGGERAGLMRPLMNVAAHHPTLARRTGAALATIGKDDPSGQRRLEDGLPRRREELTAGRQNGDTVTHENLRISLIRLASSTRMTLGSWLAASSLLIGP